MDAVSQGTGNLSAALKKKEVNQDGAVKAKLIEAATQDTPKPAAASRASLAIA